MKAFIGIMVGLLMVLSVAAIHEEYKSPFKWEFRRYGVDRIGPARVTHYDPRIGFARIDSMVYLSPPGVQDYTGVGRGGYAPFYARGTASIKSSAWYGFPRAQANFETKDLEPSDRINSQYEAWLVDEDTGYRLSLGTFTTLFGGVGELWYRTDNYFDAYEWVEITVEPYDDIDVSPGPVVLLGRIPPPTNFNPPPKQAKMITETFSDY
jgi:hypothetical protein